jgi:hypothetical protein
MQKIRPKDVNHAWNGRLGRRTKGNSADARNQFVQTEVEVSLDVFRRRLAL